MFLITRLKCNVQIGLFVHLCMRLKAHLNKRYKPLLKLLKKGVDNDFKMTVNANIIFKLTFFSSLIVSTPGELICSVVRCRRRCSRPLCSHVFSSETVGPIKAKLQVEHP